MNHSFWAESFRNHLRALGKSQLDSLARNRIDLSGVIQATLLDAFKAENSLPADSRQRLIWLRRIFLNNLLDELRHLRAQKRDFHREVPLERSLNRSTQRLEALLSKPQSSPSAAIIKDERCHDLREAIGGLPENQRRAIELHYLHSWSLERVATELNRPKAAVAALIYRGMQTLRSRYRRPEDS